MISKMLKASEFLFVCLVIVQRAIPTGVQGLTNEQREVDRTNCYNKGNVFCPEYGLCCERTEFCHERTCESCFPGNTPKESRSGFCRQLISKQTTASFRSTSCVSGIVCRDLLISEHENDLQSLIQRLKAAEKETKQAKTDLNTAKNEAKQGQVALGLGISAILACFGAGLTAVVLFVKKRCESKTKKTQKNVELGNVPKQDQQEQNMEDQDGVEDANLNQYVTLGHLEQYVQINKLESYVKQTTLNESYLDKDAIEKLYVTKNEIEGCHLEMKNKMKKMFEKKDNVNTAQPDFDDNVLPKACQKYIDDLINKFDKQMKEIRDDVENLKSRPGSITCQKYIDDLINKFDKQMKEIRDDVKNLKSSIGSIKQVQQSHRILNDNDLQDEPENEDDSKPEETVAFLNPSRTSSSSCQPEKIYAEG